MDSLITFSMYAILLLAASMVGALLPRVKKLDDRQAHLLVSLSAGVFLGLLFFLLLPEAVEECEHGGVGTDTMMCAIAAGFIVIMVIENILKHRHMATCACECCQDAHSHRITSMSAFVGLSIHAACDGLALAATFMAGETIGLIATAGMCIHKVIELFSLSTTMVLADTERPYIRLFGFALITPVAGLLFFLALSEVDVEAITGLPLAFAAGTFMYVSMCNMLPEAFHRKKQDSASLALVLVGIFLIFMFSLLFPDAC